MLINFSNHPSEAWGARQKEAAVAYGEIVDLPFPKVPPEMSVDGIQHLAEIAVESILSYRKLNEGLFAVHIMGEMSLCYSVIIRLKAQGILCLASTTDRSVVEINEGLKTSIFTFVRFREYESVINLL